MVRNLAGRTVGTRTRGTGEDYERNLWEGQGSGKGRGAKEGTAARPGEPCGRVRACEGVRACGRVGEGAKAGNERWSQDGRLSRARQPGVSWLSTGDWIWGGALLHAKLN